MTTTYHRAAVFLRHAESVIIGAHVNPDGDAIGSMLGLTIALQADIRFLAREGKYGVLQVRRGVMPDAYAHWTLPRIVGLSRAAEILLSGRRYSGEEAFALARETNRPIFLSIGYSTCHWCHVMARESFSDQEVADLLNSGFIPIKVDREERPDVDETYMTASQTMGRRGGWPLSVFLTPERHPFEAGTYYRRDQFIQLLDAIRMRWIETEPVVRREASQIARKVRLRLETTRAVGSLSDPTFKSAVSDTHVPKASLPFPA